MDDHTIQRLRQLLRGMDPYELEVVLTQCVGRFRSAGEYVRAELGRQLDEELVWALEYLDADALAEELQARGILVVLEDPADGALEAGVFVFRGSRSG